MAIGSVSSPGLLATGVQGVQTGVANANEAADRIARLGTTESDGDFITPMVDLKQSELQVKASAAVIKSADEMIGTLIDIKA